MQAAVQLLRAASHASASTSGAAAHGVCQAWIGAASQAGRLAGPGWAWHAPPAMQRGYQGSGSSRSKRRINDYGLYLVGGPWVPRWQVPEPWAGYRLCLHQAAAQQPAWHGMHAPRSAPLSPPARRHRPRCWPSAPTLQGAGVLGMIGMSYGFVPLYRMFCQATGYGGTVKQGHAVEDKLRRRAENPDSGGCCHRHRRTAQATAGLPPPCPPSSICRPNRRRACCRSQRWPACVLLQPQRWRPRRRRATCACGSPPTSRPTCPGGSSQRRCALRAQLFGAAPPPAPAAVQASRTRP
jgi:hypothetical protein